MLRFREYVRAESLEDAYERNQKKTAHILGGMLWLKMQNRTVQTVIDLSGLGLDTIEETEDGYSIGCMVSLRQLELHPGLNALTNGMIRESVSSIVGVQFRNLATVGGSIFGRFGFSDVLTMFLALDAEAELYKGGRMALSDFAAMEPDRDILVRILVKKTALSCVYLSHRNTKTDFPVLAFAMSLREDKSGTAVFGATPARAKAYPVDSQWMKDFTASGSRERMQMAKEFVSQIPMGSNIRASAAYRTHLAQVLLARGASRLCGETACQERKEEQS